MKITCPHEVIRQAFKQGYRINKSGDLLNKKGTVVKGTVNSCGYPQTSVYLGDIQKGHSVLIHRMVAYAKYGERMFIDGIEVRHKNGTKDDHTRGNIFIGTRLENIMDMSHEQRSNKTKGKPSSQRFLTPKQLKIIRAAYARGLTKGECTRLSEKFKVAKTTISSAGTGKTYVN